MDTLTASELAERVARASLLAETGDKAELVLRRIRHWTAAGALPTVGEANTGTGRHRRYARETAYLAIVLDALADRGLPIDLLKAVSQTVRELSAGKPPQKMKPPKVWSQGLHSLLQPLSTETADMRRKEGERSKELWTAAVEGTELVYLVLVTVKLNENAKAGALGSLHSAAGLAQQVTSPWLAAVPVELIALTTLFSRLR